MLSINGRASKACIGPTRRTMLQASGAGLLGTSLQKLLHAEESQASALAAGSGKFNGAHRAKSVIFMFLFGGPSQYETFDMKPDASSDIRGPYRPIGSRTPGLRICEHLPRLANVSDKFCVIRSMSHSFNDHSGGGHYIQTGHRWHIPIGGGFSATRDDWPSIGSVVDFVSQQRDIELIEKRQTPNYAVVPNRLGRLQANGQYVRPGEYSGWLGQSYNPLTTKVDRRDLQDNPYWRDCTDAELACRIEGLDMPTAMQLDRLNRRVDLLDQFDGQRRIIDQQDSADLNRIQQRALALVASSRTRTSLDLAQEAPKTRDRYGRHLFGQATLMARRLVEAGTRFVTIHYDACDGYGWDSHIHSNDVKNRLLPTFDQALSALLTDLDERGMLSETLVVALGEMGRTAKPTKDWGRGHWSTLFPAVVAGAGIRGGTTYGASDRNGEYPVENAVSPEDLAATIYYAMGIDPATRLVMPDGRPVAASDGTPVRAIFG